MRKNVRSKEKKSCQKGIFTQILSEDYWEGYYVLSDGSLALCEDLGDDTAAFTAYSMKSGRKTAEGTIPFNEATTLSALSEDIFKKTGSRISLRISDACQNPDRHEEISAILSEPDRFALLRIQNLIARLRNKSINIFGGVMGGLQLYGGGCNGFYQMNSGNILYCRDLNNWDDGKMDSIVDGVVSYRMINPSSFSRESTTEHYYGYLQGELFSSLMESISAAGEGVSGILALEGSELYSILLKAMDGDGSSAAIASHRLKIDICTSL